MESISKRSSPWKGKRISLWPATRAWRQKPRSAAAVACCMLLFVLWQCPDLWVEGSIPSRFKAPLAQLVRATVNRIAGRLPNNPEAHSFPKKCTI